MTIEWHKDILEWREGETTYISIVFSWHLPQAKRRILNPCFGEKRFVVGGPAVKLNPDYLADIAEIGDDIPGMLQRHNPLATRTSEGCIRKCKFCAVPRIEGPLRELKDWPLLPIICDNNLLACSRKHFNAVIDGLKQLDWCDFNQGLDARLLTCHHADRLAELKNPKIRLAWDNTKNESEFMGAFEKLRAVGIAKKNIQCYVLMGYMDTPEDALYRLSTIKALGIMPNPMRFQPLDSEKKNIYVGRNWTHKELIRYQRYWSNLRYLRGVPFNEFEIDDETRKMAMFAEEKIVISYQLSEWLE